MVDYTADKALRVIDAQLETLPIPASVRPAVMAMLWGLVGGNAHVGLIDPPKPAPTDRRAQASIYYRAALQREELFGDGMACDPVWMIMLDMFMASEDGRPSYLSTVYEASRVPKTTAHRTIEAMEKRGLVTRREVLGDRRRVFVDLTEKANSGILKVLCSAERDPKKAAQC